MQLPSQFLYTNYTPIYVWTLFVTFVLTISLSLSSVAVTTSNEVCDDEAFVSLQLLQTILVSCKIIASVIFCRPKNQNQSTLHDTFLDVNIWVLRTKCYCHFMYVQKSESHATSHNSSTLRCQRWNGFKHAHRRSPTDEKEIANKYEWRCIAGSKAHPPILHIQHISSETERRTDTDYKSSSW